MWEFGAGWLVHELNVNGESISDLCYLTYLYNHLRERVVIHGFHSDDFEFYQVSFPCEKNIEHFCLGITNCFLWFLWNLTCRLGIKCLNNQIICPFSVAYFWKGPKQRVHHFSNGFEYCFGIQMQLDSKVAWIQSWRLMCK